MRSLLRFLLVLLMLPFAARGQGPAPSNGFPPLVDDYVAIRGLTAYDLATLPPKDIAAAAFSTDYGRALVAELGAILADSADKSCARSKSLGPVDFVRGAGDIYQRYGTRMVEMSRSSLDVAAYEAALRAGAPSLQADLARLRSDPDVQKLIALEQPTRFSGIADRVVENFSRYLLLRRIKLTKEVSGLARGDTSLSDRYVSDDALDARLDFVADSRSAQLKRYIELLKIMLEARAAGQKTLSVGPTAYFSGVETDLAALCIPGARKP
jgi:hypothetical protein